MTETNSQAEEAEGSCCSYIVPCGGFPRLDGAICVILSGADRIIVNRVLARAAVTAARQVVKAIGLIWLHIDSAVS